MLLPKTLRAFHGTQEYQMGLIPDLRNDYGTWEEGCSRRKPTNTNFDEVEARKPKPVEVEHVKLVIPATMSWDAAIAELEKRRDQERNIYPIAVVKTTGRVIGRFLLNLIPFRRRRR